MQKKILSILLTLCMLLGMFPFAILTGAAETAAAEDDFASEPIDVVVQGTGTLDTRDRYGRIVIEDAADMVALSKDASLWGGNYILSDDIDELDLTDCGYTPIGSASNKFVGTFDGNGKTIKVAISGTTLLGLFSVIGNGAVIKNLTVTGSVTGTGEDVGGIVGVAGYATIANCTNKATVTGNGANTGGIIGRWRNDSYADGTLTLSNVVNDGEVIRPSGQSATQIGGIVGYMNVTNTCTINFTNVENNGNVTASTGERNSGIVGNVNMAKQTTMNFTNVVNNGNVGTESAKAGKNSGGIIGRFIFSGSAANTVNFTDCANNGDIYSSGTSIGGLVGAFVHDSTNAGSVVTVSGCKNTGAVTGADQTAGLIGWGLSQTSAVNQSLVINNSHNSGEISGAANTGGILGYFQVKDSSTASLEVTGCTNSKAVTGTGKAVGGIVGKILYNTSGAGTGINATLADCVNTAKISTIGEVGGILGRYDLQKGELTNSAFNITNCRNAGEIVATANESRVGGVIGMIYQQKNISTYKVTISKCLNEGKVDATGYAVGGIAGFYVTKTSETDVIENCLNIGTLESDHKTAEIGGIVGDGNLSGSTKFTICNSYNAGTITAANATSSVGHIIGSLPAGGLTADTAYYADQTLPVETPTSGGTAMTEAGAATILTALTETDGTTPVWVYNTNLDTKTEAADDIIGLELYAFHTFALAENPAYTSVNNNTHTALCSVCGLAHTFAHDATLPCVCGYEGCDHKNAVTTTVESTCTTLGYTTVECECGYTATTPADELNADNHSGSLASVAWDTEEGAIVYTLACGDEEHQLLDDSYAGKTTVYVKQGAVYTGGDATVFGSEDAPFASFEDAYAYAEAAIGAMDDWGNDPVGEIVVMGDYDVPADFTVPLFEDGITISGADGSLNFVNLSGNNVYTIYLEGAATFRNITFKTFNTKGIHLYAQNNDLTMGDGVKMVNPFEGYTDGNTLAGTKLYIFGGFNYTKLIAEQLEGVNLAEKFPTEGGEYTSDDVAKYINETVTVPAITNTITILSGEYHYVGGWHYNKDKYTFDLYSVDAEGNYVVENGEKVLKTYDFKYITPTDGTSTVKVGGSENEVPKFRHLGAFESEYASYGEGRVANIYIDGDVEIYELHLGSQVSADADCETRYPVVVNLYLAGDISGDYNNDYGFQVSQNTAVSVLGNVYVDKEAVKYDDESGAATYTAAVDAHAVLGHSDAFCDTAEADCTLAQNKNCAYAAFNYAYVAEGTCECGEAQVVADTGLAPACIFFGRERNVCQTCGKLISTDVVKNDEGLPYLDENNHVYPLSFDSYAKMSFYDNQIKIVAACGEYCTGSMLLPFPADNILYVSETGSNEFDDDLGTIDNPIGDFAIAHKLATAYSDGKNCDVTIKILDKATWTVVSGNNDTPNKNFNTNNKGMVIIEGVTDGEGNKAELYFDNTANTNAVFRFCGSYTFRNLRITLANYGTYDESTQTFTNTQIHFYARNNKIVMDTGLEMEVTEYQTPKTYNFLIYGGFNATPGVAMNTDITVRSGNYRYIGAWNRAYSDKVATGKGKLTVGATGEDTIATYFLNPYGVGADVTDNTVVDLYIDGNISVSELDTFVQNNTANGTRTTNIYFLEGADITNDDWNINNTTSIKAGTYAVNVFVDTDNAAAIADAHKIIGHDERAGDDETTTDVTELANTAHINANATICDDEACTVTSDEQSYMFLLVDGKAATATVNAYDYDLWLDTNCVHEFILEATDEGYAATCPTCGKVIETETNTVYLDQANTVAGNTGLTAETPVSTLDEAMTLLSKVGGTVVLLNNYVQAGTSAATLVATEAAITITSAEDATYALVTGGHGAGFILNGDLALENIAIDGIIAGLDKETFQIKDEDGNVTASYNTYTNGNYRTWNMVANWHNVTMTNVTVYGDIQLIAGLNRNTKDDVDTDEKTVLFNINNVVQGTDKPLYGYNVVDGQLTSSYTVENHPAFTSIFLGHRGGEDSNMVDLVNNKTVTLNIKNAAVANLWTACTSYTAKTDDNIQMGNNYSVNVNAGAGASFKRIFTGDANTGVQMTKGVINEDVKETVTDTVTGAVTYNYTYGNAYLNNLAIAFTDDAVVTESVALYNVRNLTFSIDERTVAEDLFGADNENFEFVVGLTKYYQDTHADVNESVALTYTTHSISLGKVPTIVGYSTEEVTQNVTTVECTIENYEREATCTATGITCERCAVCHVVDAATLVETPMLEHNLAYDFVNGSNFVCDNCTKVVKHTHNFVVDGDSYKCIAADTANCLDTEIPEGTIFVKAGAGVVAVDETGAKTVTVPVTVTGTLGGAQFAVSCATEGVTINTEKTAAVAVDGWTVVFADDSKSAIIINTEGLDTAEGGDVATAAELTDVAIDTVVANFVFDVETEATTATVLVSTIEAMNVALENLPHVGIGAEVSLVPHVCDYTASYKTVVDENGKSTRKHVLACVCGEVAPDAEEVACAPAEDAEGTVVTAPTCTETGITVYECATCGTEYEVVTEKVDHSFTTKASATQASEATCEAKATYYVQCDNCDAVSDTVTVAVGEALGHNYVDGTCTRCGEADPDYEEPVEHEHSFNTKVSGTIATEATCTEAATYYVQCDECDAVSDTVTVAVGEALGHNYVDGTCTRCGEADPDYEEPVEHTHNYTWVNDGDTHTGTCQNDGCDKPTVTEGHNWVAGETTAPDCENAGYTNYACDTCGATKTDDEEEATGHSYIYTNNGENHTVGCENCDYSEVADHVYEDGSCECGATESVEHTCVYEEDTDAFVPATRDGDVVTNAVRTYVCECGESYTEEAEIETLSATIQTKLAIQGEYIFSFCVLKTTVSGASDYWFEFKDYSYKGTVSTAIVDDPDTYATNYWSYDAPNIPAPEMNDKIEATLYAIIDGVLYKTETKEENVLDYFERKYEEAKNNGTLETNTLNKLMIALVNYASATQARFGANTAYTEGDQYTGLANLHIPDEANRKSSLNEYTERTAYAEASVVDSDKATELYYYNISAEMQQKIITKFAFKRTDAISSQTDFTGYTFKGTYIVNGKTKEANVDSLSFSNGYVWVELDMIAAAELRAFVTGAIYDAEGNQVSDTVSSNFECWATNQENKTATDATTLGNKLLARAVLEYSDAAKNHFGTKVNDET